MEDRCRELEGQFARLTDDGFVLRKGDVEVEIVVTDETELEGFDDLAQLIEGDRLEVEGCWVGEHQVARSVELEERERECEYLRGTVIGRTEGGFLLQMGDHRIEVVVNEETELKGFDSLDDLDGGEFVSLEGCFDGDVFVAAWIKLSEDDDCVELHGVVAERTESGFMLQVGDDLVQVAVTDETKLKGFDSREELVVGDEVGLEGCFDGDVLVAAWVNLCADEPELEWWVADGTIVDLMRHGFAFEANGEVVVVKITEETFLDGYESADQIAEGDVVLVEGWWDGEKVFAVRVVRPE